MATKAATSRALYRGGLGAVAGLGARYHRVPGGPVGAILRSR